ncbi:cytochrome c oxidase subunit 7A1, mitochondrial-like, partial [Saccoglossus kowalevskii]
VICSLTRRFSTSVRTKATNRVYNQQKHFQANKDIPVHLRGGSMDVLLYRLTMGGTVFGVGWTLYALWKASFPQTPAE